MAFIPAPILAWSPDGNWLVISDRDSLDKSLSRCFCCRSRLVKSGRLTSPPHNCSATVHRPFPQMAGLWCSADAATSASATSILLPLSERLQAHRRSSTASPLRIGCCESQPGPRMGARLSFRLQPYLENCRSRVDRSRDKPQQLTSLGEQILGPAISHRGERLAYAHDFFIATSGACRRQFGR